MLKALIGAAAAAALAGAGVAAEITGAGSTFAYPVISQWSSDYSKITGDHVNYQSIGSGAGISQIKAGTVDFGATDKPLAPDELDKSGLAQFPVIIGGILPVVHINGVGAGRMRFTGPLLAAIYLGAITKWDDPAIVKINKGLKLPHATITVVHRSDGSGTTFNWSHYLGQVSPIWKSKVGEGTSIQWPTGVGGKGNEGVAAYVNQIPNSIGYVEYAYVIQNKMAWGYVFNSAGRFVGPSIPAFQAAAATADWAHAKDFDLVMTDAPGAGAYPITATTFVLMPKHPKDEARSATALKFFRWAFEKGQPDAARLDYVALPPPLVKRIESYWAAEIK
ncbi:MAG TPA: phosphate ABC transporter substrate-binding protein PstS [Caulobacteraceae bacterium]|nr:phosphate ABC transporter substrate-binding protein PstS [Caulobacteraceae bacterium]